MSRAADGRTSLIAGEHPVLRTPYLTHAAFAKPLDQMVAAQLARAADFGAQRVNDAGADIRHQDDERVGEHQSKEELRLAWLEHTAVHREHRCRDNRDGAH